MRKIWAIFFKDRSAVWTALFTGVLSIFTYMLYQVSKSTDETQRNAERAFVNFLGPALNSKIIDTAGTWTGQEIALNWSNSGNTPARDLVIQTNSQTFRPDLPNEYDFPLGAEKTHTVIGPKGTYGTNIVIPRDSLSDAWHGKGRLFIWGAVIYKDVFPRNPERLTEFCVELTHLTLRADKTPQGQLPMPTTIDDPKAQLVGFQWVTCHAHNCYDEDCKDYADRVGDTR